MLGINKHSFATVAVAAGLLAAAGSASATTHQSDVVAYNGHAGLGAAVTDGTSNTIMFRERAAAPSGFAIDVGTSESIAADGLGADYVLTAEPGGARPHADGIIAVLIGL